MMKMKEKNRLFSDGQGTTIFFNPILLLHFLVENARLSSFMLEIKVMKDIVPFLL